MSVYRGLSGDRVGGPDRDPRFEELRGGCAASPEELKKEVAARTGFKPCKGGSYLIK